MKAKAAGITRAATLGLCLGLVIAGVVLSYLGARTRWTDFDCGEWSQSECALELETALDFAKLQLLMGAGMALLGLGGLLWQRYLDGKAASTPSSTTEG